MKCSICITQYNRIDYLLKSLSIIEKQTYNNIEIIISDNASSDETYSKLNQLIPEYRFPIVYFRFETNQGFDRNLRKTLELATGEYCFILGNDDTLNTVTAIAQFVSLMERNQYPDLGFCNYLEELTPKQIIQKTHHTKMLGSGPLVALQFYSCFSFIAGVFFKKSTFDKFNTALYDNTVYAQIALATTMITKGAKLFAIHECFVVKDIRCGVSELEFSNSYRDHLIRNWSAFKVVDGGLLSVIHILNTVFTDTQTISNYLLVRIYRKIYRTTYPFWILDYKANGALPNAVGLTFGLTPWSNASFKNLKCFSKVEILLTYLLSTFIALLAPSRLVLKYKNQLYSIFKK
jgi:glycosyltransferase involved in cell wall biosynthesis